MKKILLLLTILFVMFSISACDVESAAEHESRKAAEAESLENLSEDSSEDSTEVIPDSETTSNTNETEFSGSSAATTTATNVTTVPSSSTDNTITVYLTIRYTKAIGHPDLSITLPSSGYFCNDLKITINKDETVYNVLYNADALGHIDVNIKSSFSYGKYLIGVNGLNEFDCGAESGWKYSITGDSSPPSISMVTPKNGDHIDFFYALTTDDTND